MQQKEPVVFNGEIDETVLLYMGRNHGLHRLRHIHDVNALRTPVSVQDIRVGAGVLQAVGTIEMFRQRRFRQIGRVSCQICGVQAGEHRRGGNEWERLFSGLEEPLEVSPKSVNKWGFANEREQVVRRSVQQSLRVCRRELRAHTREERSIRRVFSSHRRSSPQRAR